MDPKKAIANLENLILYMLGSGAFKDFQTLDAARASLEALKSIVNEQK